MDSLDSTKTRLSGPSLRGFIAIADRWAMSEAQRTSCLGAPGVESYRSWVAAAVASEDITLPQDVLLNISALLGIWAALQTVFSSEAEGENWLREGLVSGGREGQGPLNLIVGGEFEDLMLVRRHLDAWCAGNFGGASGTSGSYEPVSEQMIDLR
ncbi:hypothetical protein ACXN5S_10400 [Pseudoroseicyclus sp. H15]